MRIEQLPVFTYDELNLSAQCRARDSLANGMEYPWFNESIDSIKCFCDEFGIKIDDYRIDPEDYRGSYVKTNADNDSFRGYKLAQSKKLLDSNGNGYCIYFDCINSFYEEFRQSGNAYGAFFSAIEYAIRSIESDIEYQYSKEAIEEMIDANQYEFLADGTIH